MLDKLSMREFCYSLHRLVEGYERHMTNCRGLIILTRTMRPAILFPLFAETRTLPGVGPRLEKLIAQVAGKRLVDLIFDLPTGVVDRSYRPKLIAAEAGRIATVTVNVLDHLPPHDKRQPYRVRCSDDTAAIELVFFHANADYLNKSLPAGSRRIVSGRIERFNNRLQMPHPDYVLPPEQEAELPLHEPVYALTESLPGKSLAKAIRGALEKVPAMPEWQDASYLKARGWPPFAEALRKAHAPVARRRSGARPRPNARGWPMTNFWRTSSR